MTLSGSVPPECNWFERHQGQHDFLVSPARYRGVVAGIRGGKSLVAAYDVVRHLLKYPGIEALVAAPTYPMLRRRGGPIPTIRLVAGWWGTRGDGTPTLFAEENRADNFVTFHNGSHIQYCYAADPDSIRATEASIAWLDEGALCRHTAWQVLVGRLTQQGGYPHRAWMTTTPRGRDWVYDTFVKGRGGWTRDRRDRYAYFHWRTYDNPGLRPDDILALEEAYVVGSDWHRQEMGAEFVTFRGLVYADFDAEKCCVQEAPPRSELRAVVGGVDWGTTSPGCLVVNGVDRWGRRVWLDEVYETNKLTHGEPGNDWLTEAQELTKKWGVSMWYADPEDANAILAWQRAGMNVTQADNSVIPGIRQVQSIMPTLQVVEPNCPHTLSELKQYHYREDRDGNPIADAPPAREFNHALDARRYAEMGLAATHGSPVRAADFVHSTAPADFDFEEARVAW